jgi:hypothetical protein
VAITALPGATAASVAWRRPGQLFVTAVVKATFSLVPDGPMVVTAPEPVFREEQAPESGVGLRSAGDLAPYLGQTDVCLTGHATLPAKVRRAAVRLGVFRNGAPLLDTWVELEAPPDDDGREARVRIAGLGPISRSWPVRQRLLEGCDLDRLEGPILDIPAAFDWNYFQTAPLAQQIARLGGDEWIGMVGIFAGRPRLMTRLPAAQGAARLYGRTAALRAGRPIRLVADTLHIDVDRSTCSIIWRGNFPVAPEAELASLHILAGVELAGRPLDWFNPFGETATAPLQPVAFPLPRAAGAPKWLGGVGTKTLVPAEPLPSTPLPFQPAPPPEPPRPLTPSPPKASTDKRMLTLVPDPTSTVAQATPVLPFAAPSFGALTSSRLGVWQLKTAPFAIADDETATLTPGWPSAGSAPLPFQYAPPPEPPHRLVSSPVPGLVSSPVPGLVSSPVPGEDTLGQLRATASPSVDSTLPNPPQAGLSLRDYATIKAALWTVEGRREDVLVRHGVTEAAWLDRERRLAAALSAEAHVGGSEQATALRAALGAALEDKDGAGKDERSLEEYAVILVALEASPDAEQILARYGLTPLVWRQIHAAMRRRARADPAIREALRASLEQARALSRSA